MEQNYTFEEINVEKDEKLKGLQVIADQMARKFFDYDEINQLMSKKSNEEIYKYIFDTNINNDNIKSIETDKQKINDEINKPNIIQDLNSNINTNMNTKENQNTLINTNINTATNENTFPNNNLNIENEINSIRENKKNQSSLIDETINNFKKDSIQDTSNDISISIEKVNTKAMKNFSNDSLDNIDIIETNDYNKQTKSSLRKRTIYERGFDLLKKRENKLNKKREEKKNKIIQAQRYPDIDPYSEKLMENKYIPIQQRAASIHNMKLFNNIIAKEKNKIKEYQDDMIELKKNKFRNKKFDQNNWNNFIKRQKKWNKKLQYKKKIAMIVQECEEQKFYFKPYINERSKSIIQEIEDENNDCIDDVFSRLFNDFEEHEERQKFRNQQSLPSFRPKIIKSNSQKIIEYNPKISKKCGTNPILYLNNIRKTKQSSKINKSADEKYQQSLFIDSCKNFCRKFNYKDRNKDKKYLKFINKSQHTNQQSKNNYSNMNCSNISCGLNNSKYIILDNKNINKKGKAKYNLSAPFLPLNIKKMIEKNCKENNEEDLIISNKLSKQNNEEEKYNFNHSLYNIENVKEKDNDKKTNEKYNESKLDSLYIDTERNNSEKSKKYDINNNKSNSKLSKYNKKSLNTHNESIDNDDIDNNMYKINIRDTTPHIIKENKVLASENYYDFFDIPDIKE
jgi:hypothetical protein